MKNLFKPKVVYGYFPCQSDGNDLIIYEIKEVSSNELRVNRAQNLAISNLQSPISKGMAQFYLSAPER